MHYMYSSFAFFVVLSGYFTETLLTLSASQIHSFFKF